MAIVFERLVGTTYVARGPTNLGLYTYNKDGNAPDSLPSLQSQTTGQADSQQRAQLFAIAIDSGGDEDAGRRILRECERLGVTLAALINTHSNADHCGGNAFLAKRTGCIIAATELEGTFLQYPQLEPSFLAGGFPQKSAAQ